jgi:hypothetical protein
MRKSIDRYNSESAVLARSPTTSELLSDSLGRWQTKCQSVVLCWLMRIFMFLVGAAGALLGFLLFVSGGVQGAIHEIEGLLLLLIGAVGFGSAGIIEAIEGPKAKTVKQAAASS